VAQQRIRLVGDRVHRPSGWWTPTVHALLEHLHSVGFTCVPQPYGVVDGEEVLGLIPGESGAARWARAVPEAGLRVLAGKGLEPQRTRAAEGFCDELASRVQWSRDNLVLFSQARRRAERISRARRPVGPPVSW
jgi:hypothetical protein